MIIIPARFARYVIHSGTITRAMCQQLRTIRASCVATSGNISIAYVTNCVHICSAVSIMITKCNDVLTILTRYVIIIMYTSEVNLMTTDRQQLAMNLSYLVKNEDVIPGPLLNEILIEYVELINNNRLDDLLTYTNNEVESDLGRG